MNNVNLKNKIIVAWLDLDPDQLAIDIPVALSPKPDGRECPYVCWKTIRDYALQHGNKTSDAFDCYKGSHTTDRVERSYAWDWEEFLDALRKAREIAADPGWETPHDGVVYHCMA